MVIHKNYSYFFIVLALVVLSGCTRIIDWGRCNFYQGQQAVIDTTTVRSYIQSLTMYDQFTTVAQFDVLWLSDAVRTEFVQTKAHSLGKTQEQTDMLLKRQLEENNHFITFFVLTPFDLVGNQSAAEWAMFLEIDENTFVPIETKIIELSPIYRFYLGKKYSRFKTVYQVKFDARTAQDTPLITPETKRIALHFRSTQKEGVVCWQINEPKITVGKLMLVPDTQPMLMPPVTRKTQAADVRGDEL